MTNHRLPTQMSPQRNGGLPNSNIHGMANGSHAPGNPRVANQIGHPPPTANAPSYSGPLTGSNSSSIPSGDSLKAELFCFVLQKDTSKRNISWQHAIITKTSFSTLELETMIEKQGKKGWCGPYDNLKSKNQQLQIENLIQEHRAAERNPDAQWEIVCIEDVRVLRAVGGTETKMLRVVLKRFPKSVHQFANSLASPTMCTASVVDVGINALDNRSRPNHQQGTNASSLLRDKIDRWNCDPIAEDFITKKSSPQIPPTPIIPVEQQQQQQQQQKLQPHINPVDPRAQVRPLVAETVNASVEAGNMQQAKLTPSISPMRQPPSTSPPPGPILAEHHISPPQMYDYQVGQAWPQPRPNEYMQQGPNQAHGHSQVHDKSHVPTQQSNSPAAPHVPDFLQGVQGLQNGTRAVPINVMPGGGTRSTLETTRAFPPLQTDRQMSGSMRSNVAQPTRPEEKNCRAPPPLVPVMRQTSPVDQGHSCDQDRCHSHSATCPGMLGAERASIYGQHTASKWLPIPQGKFVPNARLDGGRQTEEYRPPFSVPISNHHEEYQRIQESRDWHSQFGSNAHRQSSQTCPPSQQKGYRMLHMQPTESIDDLNRSMANLGYGSTQQRELHRSGRQDLSDAERYDYKRQPYRRDSHQDMSDLEVNSVLTSMVKKLRKERENSRKRKIMKQQLDLWGKCLDLGMDVEGDNSDLEGGWHH